MRACHCIRSILIVFRLFLLRQICNFSLQTISLKRFECNRRSLDHSLTAHLFFRQIQTLIASWRGKNECFLTHSLSLSILIFLHLHLVSVWPDLAKNLPLWQKIISILAISLTVYLVFGKMLNLLWQIVSVVNCQRMKNNVTIWSHLHVQKQSPLRVM